jgi:hypothetical protein
MSEQSLVGLYCYAPGGYRPYHVVPYRIHEGPNPWQRRLVPLDDRSYALGVLEKHLREKTLYASEAEVRAAIAALAAA